MRTIEVRVVLTVEVDPDAWAVTMMGKNPDELLQKEVRRDVKRRVRDRITEWPTNPSGNNAPIIGEVFAQGLYDNVRS